MTNEGRKIEFGVGLLLSHWADVLNIKTVSYTHLTLPTTPYV